MLALTLTLAASVAAGGESELKILKKDRSGNALYGATFVISPNSTDWNADDLTVVDNGVNDDDTADGVLHVLNCIINPDQEYTVIETVAPHDHKAASPKTGINITPNATVVTLTFINTSTTVGGKFAP